MAGTFSQGSFAGAVGALSSAQNAGAACPYCCEALEPLGDGTHPPSGFRALDAAESELSAPTAREICRRCRVIFDDSQAARAMSDEDRQRVLLAGYRARRARDRFRASGGDRFEAVSELAEAFTCLRGLPGVRPFCASHLHSWACANPGSDALRDCIAFVLHIADAGARWSLRFDAPSAMRRWDTAQRAVFLEWARRPWWT